MSRREESSPSAERIDLSSGDDGSARILRFPTPPPANGREAIGEVLREERSDQSRTLEDVARDASVSLPYLSEVERGRKEVSTELLESICDALEIEVADVFERAARKLRQGVPGSVQMLAA